MLEWFSSAAPSVRAGDMLLGPTSFLAERPVMISMLPQLPLDNVVRPRHGGSLDSGSDDEPHIDRHIRTHMMTNLMTDMMTNMMTFMTISLSASRARRKCRAAKGLSKTRRSGPDSKSHEKSLFVLSRNDRGSPRGGIDRGLRYADPVAGWSSCGEPTRRQDPWRRAGGFAYNPRLTVNKHVISRVRFRGRCRGACAGVRQLPRDRQTGRGRMGTMSFLLPPALPAEVVS